MWEHTPLASRNTDAPKSVLVVEDDESISDVICLILEEEGYFVMLNKDGDIFREALATAPDLILLDIWLPVLTGAKYARG